MSQMKYASFKTPDGRESYGIVDGDRVIDLGASRPQLPTLKDFMASAEFGKAANGTELKFADVKLLPVIPNPGKIICVGLNYQDHVKEMNRPDSEKPVLFMRGANSQMAHGDPLVRAKVTEKLDYEGELAVIIGKPGRYISKADALKHVGGYAPYNDGTMRDWQRHTHHWTPGKNFDNTGAFGPWMVTADALGDRATTFLTTRVNGEQMQRASLAQMIFSVEELIEYISGFTTLQTGDVIVTGTPGGVGDRRTPPLYLVAGDKVEIEIDGVGLLQNTVVQEA
jgi:2-keto-4-pentenoate hydratase/2-oxohepta-3-ene-1,7-dioic acid hydratase in catechol pathway